MNTLKTFLLLTGLMALFLFVGRLLGGQAGMAYAFFFSCVMNFLSYWFSDKIILMSYGAKEVTEAQAPHLYPVVRRLPQKANFPFPPVCILYSPLPHTFAT